MTVTVSGTATIAAPARDVVAAVMDVEAYPSWLEGVRSVKVVTTDDHGRPRQATFVIASPMGNVTYTVEYTYELERDPQQIRWKRVSGTMIRDLDGSYAISAVATVTTLIEAELRLDIDLPLPKSLVHSTATTVIQRGLEGLQRRCATGGSRNDGE